MQQRSAEMARALHCRTDFVPKYQSWDATDPAELFQAETIKKEANPKQHIEKHLRKEAKGVDYLVLWLDCDREGENICFEGIIHDPITMMTLCLHATAVMDNCLPKMKQRPGQQTVFRARFSSITAPDIRHAMQNLGSPNADEAAAVDARQELDLKVILTSSR